jgi:DNA-binding response OmpR family regulator
MPLDVQAPQTDARVPDGVRVLVVQGSWHIATALESALHGMGIEVVGPVTSAAEANRLAAEETPDLAVVDIKLRDEMTSSLILNMHNEGIRVVAVSGYTQFPGPTEHIAAILQKPFSESEFLATMLCVLGNDHT